MELKINEEFQSLLPRLSDDEFYELEQNVLTEGIRDPICIWNGIIVDGHHRYELAQKHDLDFKVLEKEFANEADVKIWIFKNQMARRNVPDFVKAEMAIRVEHLYAAKAKAINDEMHPMIDGLEHEADVNKLLTDTRKEIAKDIGISHGNVFKVKQILARNPDQETLDKLRSGKMTINEGHKIVRREEKILARKEKFEKTAKTYKPDKNIKIVHADFYTWCNENLEDNSVDLFLTDPPYPKEFLYLWDQLTETAARKLKPNRYLVTYSGQLHLDYVMKSLSKHLSYCWMIALFHSGPTQSVHPRNVICTWKPILVFRKGDPGKFDIDVEYVVDSFTKDYRDKEFHEWGQGEAAVAYLMDKFSKPGELVVDPFVGGGTTLVVAADRKRKCIGIEIDGEQIDIIKSNLMKPITESLI
jgi:16S rRNA G966 N2-methylase RsmD